MYLVITIFLKLVALKIDAQGTRLAAVVAYIERLGANFC
jgi:hypothetical protein